MPLETVRISIDETEYTAVGIGVTVIDVGENRVGSIRVVVVPTGGPAPTVSHENYREWDGSFVYSEEAADIYMMSPLGQAWIGVIRK